MKKFLKFLGFGDEDPGDYGEYRRRRPAHPSSRDEDYDEYERPPLRNGLIFFQGLPSDKDKLQLREALIDGCVIILDMRGIPSEKLTEVKQFVTFMEGVSFANNGEVNKLSGGLFYVSPQPGMVQRMTGSSTNRTQGDDI